MRHIAVPMLHLAILLLAGCTTQPFDQLSPPQPSTSIPSSGQEVSMEKKEYRMEPEAGERDGYALHYPAEWSLEAHADGAVLVLSRIPFEQGRGGEHNATLLLGINTNKNIALIELMERLKANHLKANPSATLSTEEFNLNGYSAARLDGSGVKIIGSVVIPAEGFGQESALPGRFAEISVDGPLTRFTLSYAVLADDAASTQVFEDTVGSFAIVPAQ